MGPGKITQSLLVGIVWPNTQPSGGSLPSLAMKVCQHPCALCNAKANPLLGLEFMADKPCES